MPIYTRKGDNGTTTLYSGEKVDKSDPTIIAIGLMDELTELVGSAKYELYSHAYGNYAQQLDDIQAKLYEAMTAIATTDEVKGKKKEKSIFDKDYMLELEKWISNLESNVPTQKNFIRPSGHPLIRYIGFSRTTCRKIETVMSPENENHKQVFAYLNRLSSYFHVLSRAVSHSASLPEDLNKRA